MHDVLISYHEVDRQFVEDVLLPGLRAAGLDVAVDEENLEPGAPLVEEAERLVNESRHMIAVLSPEYVEDNWGAFERQLAQFLDPSATERRLLPIVYRPTSLPASIQRLRVVDMTSPFLWRESIEQLVKAITQRVHIAELVSRGSNGHMAPSLTMEERISRLEFELRRMSIRMDGDERYGARGLAEELVRIADASESAQEERRRLYEEVAELKDQMRRIRLRIEEGNEARLPEWAWPAAVLAIVVVFAFLLLQSGAL